MPSSVSQGVLLLVSLCCLFSGSQPQDPLEMDVDQHDHEHEEHLPCYRVSCIIIQAAFSLYHKSENWTKHTNILFSPPDHKEQLTMNSRLFIDKNLKLKDGFVEDVNRLYHSKVVALNFNDTQRAQNQINEYVEMETHGKIAGLVKEMEADTAFALMNYIFF